MYEAQHFFQPCAFAFSWGDLSNKTVMDVGCGDGETSTKTFIQLYPNVKKLIAIDPNPEYIFFAGSRNKRPNVEFILGDIEKWHTVDRWAYRVDIIISHFSFCNLFDQIQAFRNVYKLLSSGGTAGILFTLQSDAYDWLVEVGHEYGQFAPTLDFDPPDTHKLCLSASHFKPILENIGYQVLQCDDCYHYRQYHTEEECKRNLAKLSPFTNEIPEDIIGDYIEDLYQIYIEQNPVNKDGKVDFNFTTARLFLKKE